MERSILELILAGALLFLILYVLSLKNSIREITDALEEKRKTDTNTFITVSCGDREIRKLAARLNKELYSLRKERLRLQNGNQELKKAVTNISHDLRTPLTAIYGYLELLEGEEHTDESKRYLAVIRERASAMKNLTEELFQYSVAVSTEEELAYAPVSLNAVLEESLAGFYGVFLGRKITPEIEMPEHPVTRMADKKAVRRVFDNILNNAAKYSDGDLQILLKPDGTVIFSNHAKKLGPVQAERLFDRFYTVETAYGSTGIGLSIARLLTEKMGGTINASYIDKKLYVYVKFTNQKDKDRE